MAGGLAIAAARDAALHTEGCRLVVPTREALAEDAELRHLPPPEHTAVQPVTVLRPAVPTVARIEEDLVDGR